MEGAICINCLNIYTVSHVSAFHSCSIILPPLIIGDHREIPILQFSIGLYFYVLFPPSSNIHNYCKVGSYDKVQGLLDSPDGNRYLEERSAVWRDTPLLAAARKGQTRIVELLLGHGANVNVQDSGGHTALHWVAMLDYAECAEVLLSSKDVRLDIRNGGCRTACDAAKKCTRRLIKSAGELPAIIGIYGHLVT